MYENIPCPAALDRLANVPFSLFWRFHQFQDADAVAPRQLCNGLLHKLSIRICLGKCPHVFQITRSETCHFWE